MMSCQVGGRWGSSTGVNNFVFAGFGIPFGLTFIVLCQGCELITANYMFCTFACLAAKPEDRAAEIKATLINCLYRSSFWVNNTKFRFRQRQSSAATNIAPSTPTANNWACFSQTITN
mgnify:CR=1 FL=1